MSNLIFLLDGDDVLLATGEEKIKWIKRNLKDEDLLDKTRTIDSIMPYECNKTTLAPIIGEENYFRMVDFVYSAEGTVNTKPLEGALDGVKQLSNLGEIYVASARRVWEIGNTREWIRANEFGVYIPSNKIISTEEQQFASIEPVSDSKKIGLALHFGAKMFVDDDQRHMPKKPVDGLHCLLFGPGERRNIGQHITIAKDWAEVVQYSQLLYK